MWIIDTSFYDNFGYGYARAHNVGHHGWGNLLLDAAIIDFRNQLKKIIESGNWEFYGNKDKMPSFEDVEGDLRTAIIPGTNSTCFYRFINDKGEQLCIMLYNNGM